MTRNLLVIVAIILFSGCNNDNESSPYSEILDQPPYQVFTDSIKQEPNRDDLYFRRAILLNSNDYPEPALADFRKAWSLKKDERYAFGISTILLEKNPDSATQFLDQSLKILPESFLLGLSLARAYDAQNKTDQALEVSNNLLKNNPDQVDLLKMKANLLEKKGARDESVRTLEKAYSLTPFDVELNYMLALSYAETKNSKVILLCDSLIRKDSLGMHAEPYYYKGLYYSNLGEKAIALRSFNDAIQHDYNFLDAHIEKGIILFEQKKYNEAYQSFNLAMTISPKYADAYYWMGKCQEAIGQRDEAKLNYQRAYGLDKSLVEAKQAADRIK